MLGHFGFGREVQIPLHYRVKNRFLSPLVLDGGGSSGCLLFGEDGGLGHCAVGWHGGPPSQLERFCWYFQVSSVQVGIPV